MGNEYQPARAVLERLKQVDFVAVVGPTAAGKSSIIAAAKAQDQSLHEVMNSTSRLPRPGEHDGVDYMFKDHAAMEAEINAQAYAQVMVHPSGDMYATKGDDYSTEGVAVLPVLSAVMPAFRALPFKRLRVVYVLPPSWEVWQERIASHNFLPEQFIKRIEEAHRSLEFARDDPEVLFVVNDVLGMATDTFIRLVQTSMIDETEQAIGQALTLDLLTKIEQFLKNTTYTPVK